MRPAFWTAVAASVLGWIVCALLVVLATGSTSPTGVARTALRTWLVALGSGLDAGDVQIRLVPIGATLVVVLLVAVCAARIVAPSVEEPRAFVATTAGAFGVIAGVVSALTDHGGVSTGLVRSAFGAFVVGALGATAGILWRHGEPERLWPSWGPGVGAVIRSATTGVATMLACASAIVVALLTAHIGRAGDLWAGLEPGAGGAVALAVACVLAVPTLVLWTTSALIGPGFVLGTDTSVDLTGAHLGAVPGLPVLAGLPSPGAFPDWVFVLGLVPLLAGIAAGLRLRTRRTAPFLEHMGLGAASGALAGLVLGAVVAMSGGAIGPGRMADVGPPMLTPLLVAVPVLALGGAMGAALGHYRGTRASQLRDEAHAPRRPRVGRRHQSAGPDRREPGA